MMQTLWMLSFFHHGGGGVFGVPPLSNKKIFFLKNRNLLHVVFWSCTDLFSSFERKNLDALDNPRCTPVTSFLYFSQNFSLNYPKNPIKFHSSTWQHIFSKSVDTVTASSQIKSLNWWNNSNQLNPTQILGSIYIQQNDLNKTIFSPPDNMPKVWLKITLFCRQFDLQNIIFILWINWC